jgi:hypothetical protein
MRTNLVSVWIPGNDRRGAVWVREERAEVLVAEARRNRSVITAMDLSRRSAEVLEAHGF